MNALLVPAGLPAYCVHASNPSVPNHLATTATAFVLVHAFSLLVTADQWTEPPLGGSRSSSFQGLGLGFAQQSQARRSARPNRVHFVSCLARHVVTDGFVHFRQLSTPCCHGAVAFSFRRVNDPPGGHFHPTACTPSQAHDCGSPLPLFCRSPHKDGTDLVVPQLSRFKPQIRSGQ